MPKLTKNDQTARLAFYMLPSTREMIEKDAKKHKRSMSAEMNYIIEQYYLLQDNKKESVTSTLSER
jgi:hypothetical protein